MTSDETPSGSFPTIVNRSRIAPASVALALPIKGGPTSPSLALSYRITTTMIINNHILEQHPGSWNARVSKASSPRADPLSLDHCELRSCPPSESRLHSRESSCLRNEASIFPNHFAKIILDGNTPTQLHIDFRTRRPTGIDFFRRTADQRAACTAINRERTRAIVEADQFASSGEPVSADVWETLVARGVRERDVPLIPLDCLGIHHDEDGMLS